MTYSANDTGTPTPDTTPRPTMVDTLPERFRSDRYVISLAEEADRTRADRDREATRRRESDDKVLEVLHAGIRLESERNALRAELAGIKAGQRWSTRDVIATGLLLAAVIYLVLTAMSALATAVAL